MAGAPSPLSDLLQYLDTLYTTLLNLTVKAQEKQDELEKQEAIEETRKAMLEEGSEIIETIQQSLKQATDIELLEIEARVARFLQLLQTIQSMDSERSSAFHKEREALKQALQQTHIGKQVVATYQRHLLLQD